MKVLEKVESGDPSRRNNGFWVSTGGRIDALRCAAESSVRAAGTVESAATPVSSFTVC